MKGIAANHTSHGRSQLDLYPTPTPTATETQVREQRRQNSPRRP